MTEDNLMAFPIVHLPVGIESEFQHSDFVDFLAKKWAEYNNLPSRQYGEMNSLKELNLKSVSQYKEENKKLIPRHESWRRYYRRNPYFRSYDEKMMIWMFELVMGEITPGMLKGASKSQQDKVIFWMEVDTHFLEEVSYRGMDFRIFIPSLQKISAEIENEMKKKFPDTDAD